MSVLYTYNGVLLSVDGKLAISQNCCCDDSDNSSSVLLFVDGKLETSENRCCDDREGDSSPCYNRDRCSPYD